MFLTQNILFQRNRRSLENFIKSFSADPLILAFANHLCRPPSFSYSPSSNNNKERGTDETSDAASLATFCTSVLYECLTQDKPEILQTYLSIYQTFQHQSRQVQQGLQKRSSTAIAALSLYKDASLESSLRNVHIVKMFYEHHDEAERLITPSFLFSK